MQQIIADNTISQPLLQNLLSTVERQIGKSAFDVWFRNSVHLAIDGDTVTIGAPNAFICDYLETRYAKVVSKALADCGGRPFELKFHVDPALFQQRRQHQMQQTADFLESAPADGDLTQLNSASSPARPQPAMAKVPSHQPKNAAGVAAGVGPQPLMSLERFVVGESNRMAHAAACEVVKNPGATYNPLFIHGSCGLGKTHLLHGIVNEFKRKGAGSKVMYVTAEEFTNRYIMAIKTHSLDAFRHRFRSLDVLVIDDIHFLANKTATQEEFLHTFNTFDVAGRQVIMASDCHPKMLQSVQDNLINRFVSGMVVRLNQPDRATRMEILRRKAQQAGHVLNDEVVAYIAQNITGSVRELEGALIRVVAHAALDKQRISLDTARQALGDHLYGSGRSPGVEGIIDIATDYFQTSRTEIIGRKRTRSITMARQITMYLARSLTDMSLPEIGRAMGGKNHTTVLAACRRVQKMVDDNETVTFNHSGIQHTIATRELLECLEDRARGATCR